MNRSCIARLLWISEVAFFSLDKDTSEEDKNGRNTRKLQNDTSKHILTVFKLRYSVRGKYKTHE